MIACISQVYFYPTKHSSTLGGANWKEGMSMHEHPRNQQYITMAMISCTCKNIHGIKRKEINFRSRHAYFPHAINNPPSAESPLHSVYSLLFLALPLGAFRILTASLV